MERSMFLGKDREFGVIVLAGTEKVFQKMLSNNRVTSNGLRGAVCLAGIRKVKAVLGRMTISD